MRSVRGDEPWISVGVRVWSNGRSLWIQDAKELKSSGLSSIGSGGVRSLGLSGFCDPCSWAEQEEPALWRGWRVGT